MTRVWLRGALGATATLALTVGGLLVLPGIAAASSVSSVTFTGASQAAGAATSWTVGFSTSNGAGGAVAAGGQVVVAFNPGFAIGAGPAITLGTGFSSCSASAAVSGSTVTVTLAGSQCALPKNTSAQLTIGSVTNPAAGSYSGFSVRTTSDTTGQSPSGPVVIYGAAKQLAFTTQPAGASGGTAFTSQPVVTVRDANGATVPADTSSVTLSITAGTGTSGAALSCTGNPVAAVTGVAGFAGCKIDKAGTGYTLTATDGALTAAVSGTLTVSVGAAKQLGFTVQPPATGTAGSALTAFKVAVQDAGGNTVTSAGDAITLAIASGPAGGTFGSPAATYTNVAASAGVATFGSVVLNTAGGYTFTARDTMQASLATATSTATVIGAGAASTLAFGQGPGEARAGAPITPTVTVRAVDAYGNPIAGLAVSLTSSAGPLDAGGTATTDATGLARFTSAQINTAAAGLTLTASATGLTSVTSAAFDVVVLAGNGTALTDTPADTGSGVRSVSYYYCAGFAGSCTSGNWTSIGTATGSYALTWSGQPANGAYRLVAVATDKVGNVGVPSAPIPVRVSN